MTLPSSTSSVPPRKDRGHRRILARAGAAFFFLWTLISPSHAAQVDAPLAPFRFGFSSSILLNVGQNDARAAVRVWARAVAKERGVPVDPDPNVLGGEPDVDARLREATLEAVGITLPEYHSLVRRHALSDLFVPVQSGRSNTSYLLLVHRQSGLRSLEDLRGKRAVFFENPRTCLARPWLELLLRARRLDSADSFFASITPVRKVSGAVLPVFFRQSDVGLADQLGFDTLREMNPQVGRDLVPLVVSLPLVPVVFCLRSNFAAPSKPEILRALEDLHRSPAGQQVLTVFQFDSIRPVPTSFLDHSLDLLAHHSNLGTSGSPPLTTRPAPSWSVNSPTQENPQ